MTSLLRNVAALIAAVAILQLASGLLGVRIPLAFTADGYSRTALGLVAAAYSAGFMMGAMVATVLLARVGHIRVYAACAAIFSVSTLLLHFTGDVWSWGVARMIAGPSAEQGLLIARDHYERLGGYRPDSRRSETRLLRQLGRSSRTQLRSRIMVVA